MNILKQIHYTCSPIFSPIFRISFTISLISFLGFSPAVLSAATVDDLNFTAINNDTEYSVSAKDPASIAGTLIIPATHNGKPVTQIADRAFYYSPLTSISLPITLTSIGTQAFSDCNSLTSIDLSQTVLKSIGDHAFSYCNLLASVTFPKTLTSIGQDTFYACGGSLSIDLSQTALTEIGGSVFADSNLVSITFPKTLKTIGRSAFYHCQGLTSVDLSGTALTHILLNAFEKCKMASIIFPETLTSIDERAFYANVNLASVTFLGSAPTLGSEPFEYAGSNVPGGTVFKAYIDYQAGFSGWGNSNQFKFVTKESIWTRCHYNPSSKALKIVTKNEPTNRTFTLQQSDSLNGTWADLSFLEYIQVTDSTSGTVTRTVTLDPATKKTGFYRLISISTNP